MKHTLPRPGAAPLRALPLAALLVPALWLSSPGWAQGVPGTTNGVVTGPVVGTPQERTRKEAPPPALPGARTGDADPAPMDRPPSEMNPNEALFDAINRGDITAARDAIGRGADLQATNVLGLTPTELAVDLGRNDITFLLLSLRGAGGQAARPAAAPDSLLTAANKPPPKTPPRRPAPVVAAAHPAPPPPPRQYADNPGTPVPQAGFLGFGGAVR